MNNDSVKRVLNSQRLTILYKFVDWNFEQFRFLVSIVTDARAYVAVHSNENRYWVFEQRERIALSLFNYLATVVSLVDHTRKLYREHYQAEGTMPDYEARVNQFSDDPVIQFIQKLRNYFIHYDTVALNIIHYFDGRKGISIEIHLQKQQLLLWDGWTGVSKSFIESQGNTFNLWNLILQYQSKIEEFHAWFQQEQKRILAPEWAILDSFDQKILEEVAEDSLEVLEELASIPQAFTMKHFEAQLASVTPIPFWRRVDQNSDSFEERFQSIHNELLALKLDHERMNKAIVVIKEKIEYANKANQNEEEAKQNVTSPKPQNETGTEQIN